MTIAILKPRNHLACIDVIWAAVSVTEHGEGICAITIGGVSYPLIAADPQRLEWITEQAEMLAEIAGVTIRIIKLSERTDLRTIEGGNEAKL
jgi:hypothetical protein